MRRGKVIGVLVLLAAIGLIVSEQLGQADRAGGSGSGGATDGATLIAQAGDAAARGELPAAPRVFTVDGSQSEVYWRIYKAGAMARLGHNHVISVSELSGIVTLGSDSGTSEWTLSFPVGSLVVDDPEIRARYGEDFASIPSDNDKEGTKRNMLTADVLNAEVYSAIRLSGRGFSGPLAAAELPVSIEILGRVVERSFPAQIAVSGNELTVTGEYRLTHADLGMSPFTALGGLMSVGEEIDFTYRIHAVAGAP
jgi:hypothetical protein